MNKYQTKVVLSYAFLLSVVCYSNVIAKGNDINYEANRQELLKLNEKLARSQIVDRESSFFRQVALDEFRLPEPGGLIENKSQVIAGLSNWEASDVQLTGTEVVFHGNVAQVMDRMDIDGIMRLGAHSNI